MTDNEVKQSEYNLQKAQQASDIMDSREASTAGTGGLSNRFGLFLGVGTAGVLGYGLYSFSKTGSGAESNRAMRMRVMAQGMTLGALIGIAIFQNVTQPKKEEVRVPKGSMKAQH
eukprot:TRINITY_DN851_c0_g1_i1.p2 TRINITY_DN851_c0_g1~~TRINITY_DN851_c0_g1_i1.p2  ORF type:complete len:115 (+),score=29.34 TRINITY_DN851_c0_g1_i1:34-378(+)